MELSMINQTIQTPLSLHTIQYGHDYNLESELITNSKYEIFGSQTKPTLPFTCAMGVRLSPLYIELLRLQDSVVYP